MNFSGLRCRCNWLEASFLLELFEFRIEIERFVAATWERNAFVRRSGRHCHGSCLLSKNRNSLRSVSGGGLLWLQCTALEFVQRFWCDVNWWCRWCVINWLLWSLRGRCGLNYLKARSLGLLEERWSGGCFWYWHITNFFFFFGCCVVAILENCCWGASCGCLRDTRTWNGDWSAWIILWNILILFFWAVVVFFFFVGVGIVGIARISTYVGELTLVSLFWKKNFYFFWLFKRSFNINGGDLNHDLNF